MLTALRLKHNAVAKSIVFKFVRIHFYIFILGLVILFYILYGIKAASHHFTVLLFIPPEKKKISLTTAHF